MGGRFRRIDVEVSHHTPPKFYLVPQLMVDFCCDIKERMRHIPQMSEENFVEELIELLTWAHHRSLWIHPFQDYNGRIGRLLINIILLNLDLPPVELKVETPHGRRQYVQALQVADRGNYEALQKLVRQAVEEAAEILR